MDMTNKRFVLKMALKNASYKMLLGMMVSAGMLDPQIAGISHADVELPKGTTIQSTSLPAMLAATPNLKNVESTTPTYKKLVLASAPLDLKISGKKMNVRLTAYTSSPEETDDTPFITASGSRTRDGIVATNLLPFGTKVMIPEHFGDKIFTVEDRMHPRMTNGMDVWMETKTDARRLGVRNTEIVVLD